MNHAIPVTRYTLKSLTSFPNHRSLKYDAFLFLIGSSSDVNLFDSLHFVTVFVSTIANSSSDEKEQSLLVMLNSKGSSISLVRKTSLLKYTNNVNPFGARTWSSVCVTVTYSDFSGQSCLKLFGRVLTLFQYC